MNLRPVGSGFFNTGICQGTSRAKHRVLCNSVIRDEALAEEADRKTKPPRWVRQKIICGTLIDDIFGTIHTRLDNLNIDLGHIVTDSISCQEESTGTRNQKKLKTVM